MATKKSTKINGIPEQRDPALLCLVGIDCPGEEFPMLWQPERDEIPITEDEIARMRAGISTLVPLTLFRGTGPNGPNGQQMGIAGKDYVKYGTRRTRAARAIGKDETVTVPVVYSLTCTRLERMAENTFRRDDPPWVHGANYHRLIADGHSPAEIAAAISDGNGMAISPRTATNWGNLIRRPKGKDGKETGLLPEYLERVKDGMMPLGIAYLLGPKPAGEQRACVERVDACKGDWQSPETFEAVKAFLGGKSTLVLGPSPVPAKAIQGITVPATIAGASLPLPSSVAGNPPPTKPSVGPNGQRWQCKRCGGIYDPPVGADYHCRACAAVLAALPPIVPGGNIPSEPRAVSLAPMTPLGSFDGFGALPIAPMTTAPIARIPETPLPGFGGPWSQERIARLRAALSPEGLGGDGPPVEWDEMANACRAVLDIIQGGDESAIEPYPSIHAAIRRCL